MAIRDALTLLQKINVVSILLIIPSLGFGNMCSNEDEAKSALADIFRHKICGLQPTLKECKEKFPADIEILVAGSAVAVGATYGGVDFVKFVRGKCGPKTSWVQLFPAAEAAQVCDLSLSQLNDYRKAYTAAALEEMESELKSTPPLQSSAHTITRARAVDRTLLAATHDIDAKLMVVSSKRAFIEKERAQPGSNWKSLGDSLNRQQTEYEHLKELRREILAARDKINSSRVSIDELDEILDEYTSAETRINLPKQQAKKQLITESIDFSWGQNTEALHSHGIEYEPPSPKSVDPNKTLFARLQKETGNISAEYAHLYKEDFEKLFPRGTTKEIDSPENIARLRKQQNQFRRLGDALNVAERRSETEAKMASHENYDAKFRQYRPSNLTGTQNLDEAEKMLKGMDNLFDRDYWEPRKGTEAWHRMNGHITNMSRYVMHSARQYGARLMKNTLIRKGAVLAGSIAPIVGQVAEAADIVYTAKDVKDIYEESTLDDGTCKKQNNQNCPDVPMNKKCKYLPVFSDPLKDYLMLDLSEKLKIIKNCSQFCEEVLKPNAAETGSNKWKASCNGFIKDGKVVPGIKLISNDKNAEQSMDVSLDTDGNITNVNYHKPGGGNTYDVSFNKDGEPIKYHQSYNEVRYKYNLPHAEERFMPVSAKRDITLDGKNLFKHEDTVGEIIDVKMQLLAISNVVDCCRGKDTMTAQSCGEYGILKSSDRGKKGKN